MIFTIEQRQVFIDLYKTRFGITLNEREMYERGIKLIRLIELIYKPMTEAEFKKLTRTPTKTDNF